MVAVRGLVVGFSLACAVSLTALQAGAQEAAAPPSEPTASIAATDGAPPAPTSAATPDLAPPDLPDVSLSVPAAPRPAAADAVLPVPPEATVILTVADRLRAALDAVVPSVDKLAARLPKKDREAIAAYYGKNLPRFVGLGGFTPTGNGVIARLKVADEDGLDPNDYRVPGFSRAHPSDAELAEAEVKIAVVAVAYARDARGARVDLAKISKLVTPKLSVPAADDVLASLAAAKDGAAALDAYNPPHAGYRALKAKLAELRASHPSAPSVRVPLGRALRVGMRDPRVPLIRARFHLVPSDADGTAYDERVASAVAEFQRENGLPANGILTAQTVAALSGRSAADLEGDLVANMERWRWLPPDLGARHVAVNIPEFRLRLVDRGGQIHTTKVIVGKTETPTPIFSDEMETVIVNPSWTVPPSILKKEFLPGLAQDPLYAERRGFRVYRRNGQISIQQPPGERNALGFIKFLFPNQHSVYLHDTPSRNLFNADRRAFSHGCVRVEQPFHLAEEILVDDGAWTEKRLRGLIGKGERPIRLHRTLPIHITYFTTTIDEAGHLRKFDDLYGVNRKVKAALGLPG